MSQGMTHIQFSFLLLFVRFPISLHQVFLTVQPPRGRRSFLFTERQSLLSSIHVLSLAGANIKQKHNKRLLLNSENIFNKESSAIAKYQLSNFSDSSILQLAKTSTPESFGSSTSSFKLTRPLMMP